MTKTEFVERLCTALSASGVTALVESNRTYYSEYIDGEIAKGRTEEEVLAELGAPELIANSILEANGLRDRFVDDDAKTYNAYDTPDGDPTTFAQGFEYRGKDNGKDGGAEDGTPEASKKGMQPKTKLILILVIIGLVLLGILALLVLVIGGIFALLGPAVIVVLIVWIIIKLISSATRR